MVSQVIKPRHNEVASCRKGEQRGGGVVVVVTSILVERAKELDGAFSLTPALS